MGFNVNDLGMYRECLKQGHKYLRVTYKYLDVTPYGEASLGVCLNPTYTEASLLYLIKYFATAYKLTYIDLNAIRVINPSKHTNYHSETFFVLTVTFFISIFLINLLSLLNSKFFKVPRFNNILEIFNPIKNY